MRLRVSAVDIHNFGFAGNGKMELSVAKYLSMVEASVLVIDCLPNMDAEAVANQTIPLVQYLRNNGCKNSSPELSSMHELQQ